MYSRLCRPEAAHFLNRRWDFCNCSLTSKSRAMIEWKLLRRSTLRHALKVLRVAADLPSRGIRFRDGALAAQRAVGTPLGNTEWANKP
jgi:hypothetical protein